MDEFLCETWINVYKRIRFFSSVNRVSLPPMGGEEVGKIVHTYFDVCWSAARVRKKEKRQYMEGVGEGRMRGSGVAPRYCRRRRYATSVDPSIFVFNFHLLPALIARACLHACQRVEGVEGEYSRIFGFIRFAFSPPSSSSSRHFTCLSKRWRWKKKSRSSILCTYLSQRWNLWYWLVSFALFINGYKERYYRAKHYLHVCILFLSMYIIFILEVPTKCDPRSNGNEESLKTIVE